MVLAIMVIPVVTFAQGTITVTGTVTDDSEQPVIGASVMVKGSTIGVPTDLDGKYSIDVPADAVLEFSSVGLTTADIPVNSRAVINVVLHTDNTFLESVVVVGYGTQKKGSISGAVSAVNNDDIIKTKSENVQNMLTGRIAGLRVYQKSAEPGSYNNDMDIRGMGSPLVIIDGVPRDVADFQRLNAADIENVSVLKDASASIYGLRGGNGVILVTTKKGTEGKAKVSYNGSFTFQTPSKMPAVSDAATSMQIWNEKNMNVLHNGTLLFNDDQINAYRSGELSGEDWNKVIIADWSPQTQHDLNISGGTEKIQYYVSMGYTFQDSFFKSGDLNYNKYNLRSNITAELAKGLKLDLNIAGMLDQQNNPYFSSVDIIREYWRQGPLAAAYIDDDQTMFNGQGILESRNPAAMMSADASGYRKYDKKTFQTTANLSYDFGTATDVLKGLKIQGTFSYDYRVDNNEIFRKEFSLYVLDENSSDSYVAQAFPAHTNQLRKENYTKQQTLWNVMLNYDRDFGKHHVGALIGYEQQVKRGDNYYAYGDLALGTPSLTAVNGQNQAVGLDTGLGNLYNIAYQSLIGRLNYNYDDRYLIEGQFRYDGSTKFAEGHQWGFFPSVSAAWRISEEPFFKDSSLSFIEQLKLRVSYGTTADDNADDFNYQWVTGYTYQGGQTSTNGWYNAYAPGYIFDGEWVYGANPQPLPNLDISWLTMNTFNAGIDFSAWNGKLGASFDFFRRVRKGLMAASNTELPTAVGAEAPWRNANSDCHFGLELELSHRNKVGDFSYEIKGIAAITRQRVIENVSTREYGNRYDYWRNNNLIGRNQGVQFGYEGAGRYESWEDIWSYPIYKDNSILPGDYKYVDWNGDGEISSLDEHPYAYDQNPWLNYSLDFRLAWKSLDFSMLLQGSALGSYCYEEALYNIWGSSSGAGGVLEQYTDRWRPANGSYDVYDPSLEWVSGYYAYTGHYPSANSDFNRVSTAFLRLKSIEIGYTLPKFRSPAMKDFSLRVYFNAYNPFTITKLKFVDPEHAGDSLGRMYPLSKTYTIGLNLSF